MSKEVLLSLNSVSKTYELGEVKVEALKDTSLDIYKGELIVILGPSGSGKTTLLNIIGGMDRPTTGRVLYRGKDITLFNDKELTLYRRREVGFIFQLYNLMSTLTARENVELATELVENPLPAEQVLFSIGLKDRLDHFPSQLSGGEQQRVAIARAVAKNPGLLLGDEPTGALDYETGIQILALLRKINVDYGATVVIITHNVAIAHMADRVVRLRSGEIVEDRVNLEPIPAERIVW
ncbi:MAG: ABC transporter ATP-binding protein [Firmicutes bacterium]|nr:ABC transporter ATP-binding protein [Bacillota bacterium]